MNGDIAFNTNDLQTYDPTTRVGIVTNKIDHTDTPNKVINAFPMANASKSAIANTDYPSKKITISGAIFGSTPADLDTRIDQFKGYFNGKDKNLDIAYGSSTRRYTATANGISIKRQDKQLFAEFKIVFFCALPYGQETTLTEIGSDDNFTSATQTYTATLEGSAPYQYPMITITIDALTGTGDYVQISNDNNGQEMLLFGLGFVADDVIIIDCFNRTVTVNDLPVDYLGTFLEIADNDADITYTDGFDTRTVDILIEYYKRYL